MCEEAQSWRQRKNPKGRPLSRKMESKGGGGQGNFVGS